MSIPYKTLRLSSSDEFVINKSRFIGYACPCETEEEALAFLNEIRTKHKDATHNCYAYVIGRNAGIMRYSDDGEPGGTAGMPIMEVLKAQGVVNCCVVVTRYFGGVLLGAGGLVRAYTSSVKLGLEAAGICDIEEMCVQTWDVDYTHLAKIQNMAGTPGVNGGFSIEEIRYTDVVSLDLACVPEDAEGVISQLTNVTAGRGTLKTQESRLVKRLI